MKFKIGGVDAHPTKGFRGFARPRKTNTRRKLIPVGTNIVPLSRVNRLKELRWDPKLANWREALARYRIVDNRRRALALKIALEAADDV